MSSFANGFFLDLLYPENCFFCGKAGTWLCEDCFTLLEISPVHKRKTDESLSDLYVSCSYKNRFVKKLVCSFKYEPFLRSLGEPLAGAICGHLASLEEKPDFSDRSVVAVPLVKKRLRWRGFNQAEVLAKILAAKFGLPFLKDALDRSGDRAPQTTLAAAKRKTNVKGFIECCRPDLVKGSKILLVDDIVTTGATMKECAHALKKNGAQSVVGIAVAHAEIGN
jgi:ComF family protein